MFTRTRFIKELVRRTDTKVGPNNNKLVTTIHLTNPKALNALTVSMGEEFKAAIAEIKKDTDVRAVVLTGEGSAFSAGGDMDFLRQRIRDTVPNNITKMREFYARFLSLRSLDVPVVAAINGHAIGAGFCIALACDYRVAAEKAKLAINFTRLGIHPGMGGTYFLPKLAGHAAASQLILTGDTITSAEAHRLGLVTKVCPTGEATVEEAMAVATRIATASPMAVKESLRTLRKDDTTLLDAALEREAGAQAICYAQGRDLDEAIAALKEKRTPEFE